MKKFWKIVLAVICGLLIMSILKLLIFLAIFGSMSGSGKKSAPSLPREGVLRIDMSAFALAERSTTMNFNFSPLQSGSMLPRVGIRQAVDALGKAAEDPGVKFVFLKSDGAEGSFALLEEFREALDAFRKSGKAVVSYTEMPTTGSYYMASAADKVYMLSGHGAESMFHGVGGQLIFLKDILDKLGVNVQLIRHGKYKSAGEMYIRSEASPENIEQNKAMITSIWKSISDKITASREVSAEALDDAINNMKLSTPESFQELSLIDGTFTQEEMKAKIAELAMAKDYSKVSMIEFPDYVTAKCVDNFRAKQKIAIVYAEGNIVEASDRQNICGETYAKMLSDIRADSTVKAVVLRVNSPGGSVLASDKIKREVDELRKVKPVIASYGGYAASGGYWISNSCDKIYSDQTTLTGSIGVFSMIPDLSKTAKDIAHVNVQFITSHNHSDMYSGLRPLSDAEKDYMQGSVERIYDAFVQTVSEGRSLEPDFVDSIAQGRVWTGSDALKIGLVDELGTLQDALRYAAMSASSSSDPDLSTWQIKEYPAEPSFMDALMSQLGQGKKNYNVFAGTPLESAGRAFLNWKKNYASTEKGTMFATMPFEFEIR